MMAKEPENKDMLLAFSSCPGYVSVRNRENGSWFIQDLCEVQKSKVKIPFLEKF